MTTPVVPSQLGDYSQVFAATPSGLQTAGGLYVAPYGTPLPDDVDEPLDAAFKSLGYVPGPPVTGLGPGIEEHLKDNPELREKLLKPVEGLGEGIESHLKDNPELRKELETLGYM